MVLVDFLVETRAALGAPSHAPQSMKRRVVDGSYTGKLIRCELSPRFSGDE